MTERKFDKQKLFDKAVSYIQNDRNNHFVADVYTGIGISGPTLYSYFPVGSTELGTIHAMLEENKIALKKRLRRNWADSDAPVLQLNLYKLTGTPEERNALSHQSVQIQGKVEVENKIDVGALSITALLELKKKFYNGNEIETIELDGE
tara:strand:+ start:1997 stop:2443 length:447 start_codon:yes stop_codon:yes gene_type:complete